VSPSRGAAGYIIARLGGLPCDVMDGFSTGLGDRVDALAGATTALDRARAALSTCLHEHIPGAVPERRRALLAIKRDCYNLRPLRRHRATDAWAFVEEAAGPLATLVLEAEGELEGARSAFAAAYDAEAVRQGRHLAALLEDPLLRTGLAVASPPFAREASRLRHAGPEDRGRRERRLATTLLRYASRAALKLSPFSTFTPVGLAQVVPGSAPLTLAGSPWDPQSLVRVRRHVLDRCADLLQRYPPWRRRLVVTLNDSAVGLEDGRVLLRRPSHYRPDEQDRTLRYHEEALVRAFLRGPLVEVLRSLLAARLSTYGELLPALRERLGAGHTEADIARQLDHLVDIGFLHLLPPWTADDRHLEKTMVRELRGLPPEPGLEGCVASLERLVALEESLMGAADPAGAVREMEALIDRAIEGAARAGGVGAHIDVTGGAAHDIYQDVWCAPRRPGRDALVRLGRAGLDDALSSVRPLVGYGRLWDRRLDFLYTLGAMIRRRGGSSGVPLLEAFHLARQPWQAFVKAHTRRRGDRGFERATWNPLGLPLLGELASWRDAAHVGLDACLVDGPDGRRIRVEDVEALLRPIPRRFTESHTGACLFLQPAAADGSLWMLNRLKEGTGRYGSRYTPVMPPGLAGRYAAGLRRRGHLEIEGEPVELLDVQCIQGDTLNVHAPQTPKVLTLPGASVALPGSHRRGLNDMVVTVDHEGWPQLRDVAGQRYLPVYLGVADHSYLPTLVKFLCAFGPTEMGAVFPAPLQRERDGLVVRERTVIGNVVLHRRAWAVPVSSLRGALAAPADSDAFAALHRWRRGHGIPERVFAIERVPHPSLDHVYKPQYLDFTSPLFIGVLRAVLEASAETLLLEEALPAPDAFPRDREGRRWAVELLVDSLSLPPSGDSAAPTDSRTSTSGALDDRAERLNNEGGRDGCHEADERTRRDRRPGDRAALRRGPGTGRRWRLERPELLLAEPLLDHHRNEQLRRPDSRRR
jgi:hypothetical protein